MSTTRAITAQCSLTPEAAAVEGNCAWCGTELPRTKSGAIHKTRVWCGKKCQYAFLRNHLWSWARDEAVRRDKHRCTAVEGVVRCPVTSHLEVNHIHALADQGIKGYGFGCHHHQENLETLCRPHHVKVTTAQRRARKERG